MKHDSTYIQNPSAQPALQRTAWGFVTAAFWLLYLYLLMPLVTLLMWALGVRTAVSELYLRDSHVDPFLLVVLPVVAMTCAALLIGWATYNRARFRDRERRSHIDNVTREEIAGGLGAEASVSLALSEAKICILHMDDAANPTSLTATMPGVPRMAHARVAGAA